MPQQYTVRDPQTGRVVTFRWNGPNPPTDTDIGQVFAEAALQPPQQPQGTTSATSRGADLWNELKSYAGKVGTALNEFSVPSAVGGVAGAMAGAPFGMPIQGGIGGAALARLLQGQITGEDPISQILGIAGQSATEAMPALATPVLAAGRGIARSALKIPEEISKLLGSGDIQAGELAATKRILDLPGFRLRPKYEAAKDIVLGAERDIQAPIFRADEAGRTFDPTPALEAAGTPLSPTGSVTRSINTPGSESAARRTFKHLENKVTQAGPDPIAALAAELQHTPPGSPRFQELLAEAQNPRPAARIPRQMSASELRQMKSNTEFVSGEPHAADSDKVRRGFSEGVSQILKNEFPEIGPALRTEAQTIPIRDILNKSLGGHTGTAMPKGIVTPAGAHPLFSVLPGRRTLFAAGADLEGLGRLLGKPLNPQLLRLLAGAFAPAEIQDPQRRALTP